MLRLYTVMNKTDRWARSCQRAKQSQPDGLEGHEVFYWREVTIVLWMLRNKANSPCRADGGHSPPYETADAAKQSQFRGLVWGVVGTR